MPGLLTVIPVTTPPDTTATADAGVMKPPPVSVTGGADAYPLPPLVTVMLAHASSGIDRRRRGGAGIGRVEDRKPKASAPG